MLAVTFFLSPWIFLPDSVVYETHMGYTYTRGEITVGKNANDTALCAR